MPNDTTIAPHGGTSSTCSSPKVGEKPAEPRRTTSPSWWSTPASSPTWRCSPSGPCRRSPGSWARPTTVRPGLDAPVERPGLDDPGHAVPVRRGGEADRRAGNSVALLPSEGGEPIAILDVAEVFQRDREKEALGRVRDQDLEHPGVQALHDAGDLCSAGTLRALRLPEHDDFLRVPPDARPDAGRVRPSEGGGPSSGSRRGTRSTARTSTCRSARSRSSTGSSSIPWSARRRATTCRPTCGCGATRRSSRATTRRTARWSRSSPPRCATPGPKEAIWHAICRKNYGCTHFIVGRDHAGVGDYYGTYDAQRIFERVRARRAGHHAADVRALVLVQRVRGDGLAQDVPARRGRSRVSLSGTKVREMLRAGERPPIEFSRPEVADILIDAMRGGRTAEPACCRAHPRFASLAARSLRCERPGPQLRGGPRRPRAGPRFGNASSLSASSPYGRPGALPALADTKHELDAAKAELARVQAELNRATARLERGRHPASTRRRPRSSRRGSGSPRSRAAAQRSTSASPARRDRVHERARGHDRPPALLGRRSRSSPTGSSSSGAMAQDDVDLSLEQEARRRSCVASATSLFVLEQRRRAWRRGSVRSRRASTRSSGGSPIAWPS